MIGLADAASTVSINGSSSGIFRKGQYFQGALSVLNSSSAVWQPVTVTSSSGGSNPPGYIFVPPATETFDVDPDGNLLNDSRWDYTWDAENRLVKMESKAGAPVGSRRRLQFEYDFQGRRIKKVVTNLETSTATETRFVYDGWNLIAELNSSLIPTKLFYWGLDLSGSIQGAGGVGGLLLIKIPGTATHCVAMDGNGNVAGTIYCGTTSAGQTSAAYEYGPFGELLRATGSLAALNPFRFSTKYQDTESDFLYYGHRYYNPSTGRWLSRDRIEELGGINLHAFVQNKGPNDFDVLGQSGWLDGITVVSSLEGNWDLCKGDGTLNWWLWVGKGKDMEVGRSARTWGGGFGYVELQVGAIKDLLPHFKCGDCCCDGHEENIDINGGLGGFLTKGRVSGGLLVTPQSCGVNVEGIILIDMLPLLTKAYPPAQPIILALTISGFDVSGGIQIHGDFGLCRGSSGGTTVNHARAGLGGYVEIGWHDPFTPNAK